MALTDVSLIAAGRYHGLALVDVESSLSWSVPPVTLAEGNLLVSVSTKRGRHYVVESTHSLGSGGWAVERRFSGNGGTQQLSFAVEPQRFFRFRRMP